MTPYPAVNAVVPHAALRAGPNAQTRSWPTQMPPNRTQVSKSLLEHIRELEQQLLQPEVRRSRENLEELLADEFTEFASDGAAYTKAQVIDALQSELPSERSLFDFRLVALAEDVVLSTYRSTRRGDALREPVESLRSSIWKRHNDRWQIIFHQGTRSAARSHANGSLR